MDFNFFNILILLGAIQGFVLSILLFFSKRNNLQANRLLACLILIIALACLNLYVQESGLYRKYEVIRFIIELFPFVMAMACGPLIYFYTKSIVDPDFKLKRIDRIHFIPLIIDLVPPAVVWYFFVGLLTGLLRHDNGAGLGSFIDEYNAYADVPRWLSITIYVWLSVRHIKQFLSTDPGWKERSSYQWLSLFLKTFQVFQILWFFFLVPYIIPSIRYPLLDTVGWYPIYIPLVIIIYWLGMRGYFQTIDIFNKKKTSAFSEEFLEKTVSLLRKSMEDEKLFLNPELTVGALGTQLNIPSKTISAVLNQHLNSSFNEFINGYRVEEVKRRLAESNQKHLTIAGMAMECGFNSQATFQRVFKQVTGVSPSEYISSRKPVDFGK